MRKQQFEALLKSGLSQSKPGGTTAAPVTPVSVQNDDKAMLASLSALARSQSNGQGIRVVNPRNIPPCF